MKKYKTHAHDYMVTVKFSLKERLKQIICLIFAGEIRYWMGEEEIEKRLDELPTNTSVSEDEVNTSEAK